MAVELIVPQAARPREERQAELLARFHYAESWRSQYDERAVEWYKLYVGFTKEVEGRSNLHIPRLYEQLDTIRARIFKSFTATRPYIDFIPMPTGLTAEAIKSLNAEKATIAAALVDAQLERNGWQRLLYDYLTSLLVFPAAILAVGWRFERRPVRRRITQPVLDAVTGALVGLAVVETTSEETVWDDNELNLVDFFDFWPDPRGRDLDSCRFVFQREFATAKEIEERLEVLAQAGQGEVYPVNWEDLKSAAEGLEEGRWERLSAVGLAPETSEGPWSREEGDAQRGHLHEVLHYWQDDRHALLIDRTALAYDGANPYWRHSSKPYVVSTWEPLPNEFYGLSAAQILEHLQHELNTTRNQRIDNVSMVINRMWKVRRSADIDESELVSRPHGAIYVDNPDDVEPLLTPDVTASAYNEEMIIKQDMENAVGTPPVVRGASAQRGETATEVVTKTSNAEIRFAVKIALVEALGLKRLARLMDLNNQQFIEGPRLVKVWATDTDAKHAFQWRLVQPGELIGEYDYRPSGSNADPAANKEVRRQQLTQVMQIVLATQNPFVDKYELTKAWLEAFDLRNVEKLLLPKEEVMAQLQAAQAVLAGQPAQPAAGAPITGGQPGPLTSQAPPGPSPIPA